MTQDTSDMILLSASAEVAADPVTRLDIFHGYLFIMIAAFVVTLVATPIMRHFAIANGIVDSPNDPRKIHKVPIAYLGGAGVFLGIMAGIALSYLGAAFSDIPIVGFHETQFTDESRISVPPLVPVSIVLGMLVITVLGLLDDVFGIDPRLKISGQLFAAAALAFQDVGVKVAAGLMIPLANVFNIPTIDVQGQETLGFILTLPAEFPIIGQQVVIDLVYWIGTAIIAICVLGACNASNLIDGLDGLLSGVTAICVAGLLFVSLSLALVDDGPRDAQRIVLCMAVLGACLGFLPWNFNPANIFLGDTGSMLLGYITIVIILTLGDTGETALVIAGLTMYAIPIIDTVLAIVRRKMAGKKMSDPDADHLHHMLKRALGVKGAVFSLYGIGLMFAVIGAVMSVGRDRVTYLVGGVIVSYIVVTAIKLARKRQAELKASAAPTKSVAQKPSSGQRAAAQQPARAPGTEAAQPIDASGPPA
ncbi:MAG: MraY family glycosyltransferase [Planctomycetota bacterium]